MVAAPRPQQAIESDSIRRNFARVIAPLCEQRGLDVEAVMGMARVHLSDARQDDTLNYAIMQCLLGIAVLNRARALDPEQCDQLRLAATPVKMCGSTAATFFLRGFTLRRDSDLVGELAAVLHQADLVAGYTLSRMKPGTESWKSELARRRIDELEAQYLLAAYCVSGIALIKPAGMKAGGE